MNKWKVTAWIFITLFLLVSLTLIGLYSYGTKIYNNKYTCSNICSEKKAYGYEYDIRTDKCYCYNQEGQSIFDRILK